MPQGVRMFHKFDPVPSIMMWLGQFAHEVANPFMLWDVNTGDCSPTDSCVIMADGGQNKISVNGIAVDPTETNWYLCDAFSVKAQATPMPCWTQVTSYMSVFNPLPCGQAVAQRLFEMVDGETVKLNEYDATINKAYLNAGNLQYIAFREFENYDYCVESWIASTSAYLRTAAVADPKFMGVAFTFTWLHSTYGYYPLCVKAADGSLLKTLDDGEDAFEGMGFDMSCTMEATCLNACTPSSRRLEALPADVEAKLAARKLTYSDYDCFGDCMDALCGEASYDYGSGSGEGGTYYT
jgi:hypothetical protein